MGGIVLLFYVENLTILLVELVDGLSLPVAINVWIAWEELEKFLKLLIISVLMIRYCLNYLFVSILVVSNIFLFLINTSKHALNRILHSSAFTYYSSFVGCNIVLSSRFESLYRCLHFRIAESLKPCLFVGANVRIAAVLHLGQSVIINNGKILKSCIY